MPRPVDDWPARLNDVVGCLTAQRPVVQRPGNVLTVPTLAFFAQPAPLRITGALSGARLGLRLSVDEAERTPDGNPTIAGYEIFLADRDGVELLTFHQHLPGARGSLFRPHVHVSAALRPRQPNGDRGLVPLDKLHLPTGRVTLGDVVSMLVEEFGAEPRVAHWRQRLASAGTPFA